MNQGGEKLHNKFLRELKTPYEFSCLRRERVCFYISSLFSKHEDDRSEGAGREVVCPQWEDKVVDFV